MTALVSVVIPVYNGIAFLEKTVNTILAQDYPTIEILLINDGSSDGSENLLEQLAKKHDNIKAFHKTNGGVAAARNFGIAKAEGEFIAFCDQDDLWLPSKLSQQMPLFENPEVGLVYSGAIAEYVQSNTQKKPAFNKYSRGEVFQKLIQENMFTCCTVVARKNLLLETKAFDEDRELMGVDDWLAWLKLALVCKFDFIAEYLAIHIFHTDNYSSNEEKMHKAELVCLSKIEPLAKKYEKIIDWQTVRQNIHVRYAKNYLNNGMFKKAGSTFIRASQYNSSLKLKFKGQLLTLFPDYVLILLQKLKRALRMPH